MNSNEDKNKVIKAAAGGFGMKNPVAGMPEQEALRIAEELGEGRDMGTWREMSGEQFMKWWRSSNKKDEN